MVKFKIIKTTKSGIRLGEIKTRHGKIQTPFFMPDATRGFIKTVSNQDLGEIGMGAMVVNTYHLYLQPKIENIKRAGGIHGFMDWQKPLLADSGGFQVFSLVHKNSRMGRITDKSVIFKSPLDGSWHEITPEKSLQIQFDLGVDMMVCLDDCPPNHFSKEQLAESVNRTIAWAERCRKEYDRQIKKRKIAEKDRPLLFAVIQGGSDLSLRKYCTSELVRIGFDGYGFGAMPVDAQGKFLSKVLKYTAGFIPENALRFALGIGNPEDILECASYGWDMFDCVIPTREGRHGRLFSRKGISNFQFPISKQKMSFYKTINITNARFAKDLSPINKISKLPDLRNYSQAYLHHLFKMKETLGQRLASLQNLEFYLDLMSKIRENH